MLNTPETVTDLICRWPTVRDFATDIGCGVEAAFQMKKRNRIAPERWSRVAAAAAEKGIPGIDHDWFMATCRRNTKGRR
jgi:hypothetical protein